MRMIMLALVAGLVATGSLTHAQDARLRKAKLRTGEVWAVAHQEAPPVQNLPQAPPVSLAVPVVPQQAPLPAPVVAHPGPHTEACHDSCPNDCNTCGVKSKLKHKCSCLLDFLCYRRARCCKTCGYYPYTPLYLYFLDHCKEGACHTTQCAGPTCGAGGCWSKTITSGHSMFAMPTGHGVGGVR